MKKLIADIAQIPEQKLEFFFFDVEDEKITIQDSHDIEYFLDQN